MQILYSKYNAIHKTLQKALYKSYSYNANVFAVNELPKQLQVNEDLHCTGGKCCETEMNSYMNNKGTEKKRHDYYLLCWILWQVDIFFKYLAFVQSQLHRVNRPIHLQRCSELACPLTLSSYSVPCFRVKGMNMVKLKSFCSVLLPKSRQFYTSACNIILTPYEHWEWSSLVTCSVTLESKTSGKVNTCFVHKKDAVSQIINDTISQLAHSTH